MRETEVTIVNRLGLHARAASRFVNVACRFRSRVQVTKKDSTVDGKSILGLLTLAAARGTRLRLSADGPDEREALEGLAALVRDRFGEGE